MFESKAYRVHQIEAGVEAKFETVTIPAPEPGEVVVRSEWSTINYKDALAVTGKGRIMRHFPMTAGIDMAGTVAASNDSRFREGDAVLIGGANFGEAFDGGYSEYQRVDANIVVPMPKEMDARMAMALGTAGFTAALALERMEHNGSNPSAGPIAVTGPTGGVGGVAIDIFAGAGYEVTALTHKSDAGAFLKSLGASDVQVTTDMELGERPLEKTLWGGAVDNVGGELLSWLCRTTKYGGNVAAIGLAASPDLAVSVMPFILRGVNLLGINSVSPEHDTRIKVWNRLATDLRPAHLEELITREVAFDALPGIFDAFVAGSNTGRTLIRFD